MRFRQSKGVYFNPWDPEFRANPYPHYKALHHGPPRLIKLFKRAALVARYSDVAAALQDHLRFSSVQRRLEDIRDRDPFAGAVTMLFSDPPVHTRLRRLVSRDFTPKRICDLTPRIREIVDGLLDQAGQKGGFELMGDVANPLPVMVIAEMLGVPSEKYATFKRWTNTIVAAESTMPGIAQPPEVAEARNALRDYFGGEIERRHREPGPDLISALVAAHDQDEALNAHELFAFVLLLLLAGNETTTNLIGNGMLALGQNPDQMARLRSDPSLMPGAIEEMLRYDGPVQSTVRTATEEVNLGGTTIAPGTHCFIMLAAANRDPAKFAGPDRFDVTRDARDHMAFGDGIHFCIGAPLARLEGSIAIGTMLERFPRLRLADPQAPLTYKGSYFLRGLRSLAMSID